MHSTRRRLAPSYGVRTCGATGATSPISMAGPGRPGPIGRGQRASRVPAGLRPRSVDAKPRPTIGRACAGGPAAAAAWGRPGRRIRVGPRRETGPAQRGPRRRLPRRRRGLASGMHGADTPVHGRGPVRQARRCLPPVHAPVRTRLALRLRRPRPRARAELARRPSRRTPRPRLMQARVCYT
jgi:hypothetical protein